MIWIVKKNLGNFFISERFPKNSASSLEIFVFSFVDFFFLNLPLPGAISCLNFSNTSLMQRYNLYCNSSDYTSNSKSWLKVPQPPSLLHSLLWFSNKIKSLYHCLKHLQLLEGKYKGMFDWEYLLHILMKLIVLLYWMYTFNSHQTPHDFSRICPGCYR